ncbi:MAG: hypothetical protein P8X57_00215, partial [Cyclobacteriaceae bacterium]
MGFRLIAILLCYPAQLWAQSYSLINSPVEQAMAGISAISDGGFAAVHNPAAIRNTLIFLSLGTHYRGTGIYAFNTGGTLCRNNTGIGAAVQFFGDRVYREWNTSISAMLKLKDIQLGIAAGRNTASFLQITIPDQYYFRAGFHTRE